MNKLMNIELLVEQLTEQVLFNFYRFGAYVLLHCTDDPALLAIAFC